MNARLLKLVVAASTALSAGCGLEDSNTPKMGRWTITALTGDIQMVDSGECSGSWTFPPDLQSTWNGVTVKWNGDLEYFLGFSGVSGSPHPDGYNEAGAGSGRDGVITGKVVREDLGLETSIEGTYDSEVMTVAWTTRQHVGEAGGCVTDVTGSGTFTAIAPK